MLKKNKIVFFILIFSLSLLFINNKKLHSQECDPPCPANYQCFQGECVGGYQWPEEELTECDPSNPDCPSGFYCHPSGFCIEILETTPYGTSDHSHLSDRLGPSGQSRSPDLNPLGQLQVRIPGIDELVERYPVICEDEGNIQTCKIPWVAIYIHAIYNYLIVVGGIVATIALMIGGVIWLMSAGNASRITEAKGWIGGSITGVLILLTSYVLLNHVNPNLVGLRYLELQTIEPLACVGMDETQENPYLPACIESRKGNLSLCRALGSAKPGGLVRDDASGQYVHPDTLKKFNEAMKCVKDKNNGRDLFIINEGWRSPAEQIRMKELWTSRGSPGNAAPPCCSNHGSGKAIDIIRRDGNKMSWDYNNTSGLKECMNQEGLKAEISSEPWHWSPTGR